MTRVPLALVEKPKEAEARPGAELGHFLPQPSIWEPMEGQLRTLGWVPTAGSPGPAPPCHPHPR